MSLMNQAKHVSNPAAPNAAEAAPESNPAAEAAPPSTPPLESAPPSDPPKEPDNNPTLLMRKKKGSRLSSIIALGVGAVLIIGAIVLYSTFGGDDAPATTVVTKTATKAVKPVLANTPVLPAECQGDLSGSDKLLAWYCQGVMPWKLAVDGTIGRLKTDVAQLKAENVKLEERLSKGTSNWVWLFILLVGALGATNVIMLRRHVRTRYTSP
jgi:hypothetical protein